MIGLSRATFIDFAALTGAGILFLSASLKTLDYVGLVNAFGSQAVFANAFDSALHWCLIAAEVYLAILLVVGRRHKVTFALGTVFFSTLAAVTGYFVVTNAQNCNCFGPLQVQPQVTFWLDVALASLMAFAWFSVKNSPVTRGSVFPFLRASTLLFLVWVAVFSLVEPLLGAATSLRPPVVLGVVADAVHPGKAHLLVYNRTAKAVRLVGSPSVCDSEFCRNLPATIPPKRFVSLAAPFGSAALMESFEIPLISDSSEWFSFSAAVRPLRGVVKPTLVASSH